MIERHVLQRVAAQTADDAQRLRQLGAGEVAVLGNTKFDQCIDPHLRARGEAWRELLGERSLLLFASSRDGEEALVLAQLKAVWPTGLLLVLVPRHPQRFDLVEQLITEHGLNCLRRSQWDGVSPIAPEVQVLLGDSMGEMPAWYAMCARDADAVLMGGSLLPFGSQNLIEACAQGAPVVLGPSSFNFADVARSAVDAGAAEQLPDASQAIARWVALCTQPERRIQMAQAGIGFALSHQGASQRLFDFLLRD